MFPQLIRWMKLRTAVPEVRVLLSNFFSLSLLQAANFILPLLTLPYLVRVLGYERFGLLAFATATVAYFQILTEYGFNLSATREIAINKGNQEKLNEIFSSVMFIKIALTTLSLSVLAILLLTVDLLARDWIIYVLTFGVVVGQVFLPVWFFLGIERMKYITLFNVIAKLIFTLAIFLFVKSEKDHFLVPLLTSLGYLMVAFWSLFVISKKFKVELVIPTKERIFYHLRGGWYVFVSNAAVSLYTMTTIVLLGFFTNNLIVGYYSIADKLINAVKSVNNPIAQTLYPYVNRKAIRSMPNTLIFIRKILIGMVIGMGLISFIIFFFSMDLIDLLFGRFSFQSVIILRILSVIPLMVGVDTILGTLMMLIFNRNREYSHIIISAGFVNLVISFFLIFQWEHIGAAISVLITECYITVRLLLYTQKNGLSLR